MVTGMSGRFDGFASSGEPGLCCREFSGSTVYRASNHVRPANQGKKDQPPKLLRQLKQALRARQYSLCTESTYCQWVKRSIFFHNVRYPAEMAEPEINAFLTHLAVKHKVNASTQNQALSALLFLYRHVIGHDIGELGDAVENSK
ncbi:MAG: site-specific integrase [Syntrophotaleaceae bacterium]